MFFYIKMYIACIYVYILIKISSFILMKFKKSPFDSDEVKIKPIYERNNKVLKNWDKLKTEALKADASRMHNLYAKYWFKHALIKQELEHFMEEVQNDN